MKNGEPVSPKQINCLMDVMNGDPSFDEWLSTNIMKPEFYYTQIHQ